ncbi:hypothetical protein E2I00_009915, partial [Balaenoptera physalus]
IKAQSLPGAASHLRTLPAMTRRHALLAWALLCRPRPRSGSGSLGSTCDTPASCLKQVQNVQHYHVRTLGGFLMGEDRLQYEGRGWNTLGAHSGPTWNPIPLGISFMGNYMDRVPPPRAIRAAQGLLACGVAQGFLTPSYEVKGHRVVEPCGKTPPLYHTAKDILGSISA